MENALLFLFLFLLSCIGIIMFQFEQLYIVSRIILVISFIIPLAMSLANIVNIFQLSDIIYSIAIIVYTIEILNRIAYYDQRDTYRFIPSVKLALIVDNKMMYLCNNDLLSSKEEDCHIFTPQEACDRYELNNKYLIFFTN